MWNALPRSLDLPRRDVDPEQPVALREALRGRASAPTAELEQSEPSSIRPSSFSTQRIVGDSKLAAQAA